MDTADDFIPIVTKLMLPKNDRLVLEVTLRDARLRPRGIAFCLALAALSLIEKLADPRIPPRNARPVWDVFRHCPEHRQSAVANKAVQNFSNLNRISFSLNKGSESHQGPWKLSLPECRWFKRGWTLQELIAPKVVEFYSQEWHHIGSKALLEREISKITCIPAQALRESRLDGFSFTERISWGETRHTKYDEDKVYSLFGICGVFLLLNYGEGKKYAFQRLHDEIDRVTKLAVLVLE
jgi:hypothetical protein